MKKNKELPVIIEELESDEAEIRQFLTDHYPEIDIHFLHNADYEHNNNIYSLWMTRELVRGRDFLLMDSDILCDPKIVARVLQEPGTALALNRHELGEEEIKVIVDDQNRILEISKTCSIQQAIGESVGIEKMTADYSEALFRVLAGHDTKGEVIIVGFNFL